MQLDSRGLLSPETTRTMNLLQARLLTSLNRYIAAVVRSSSSSSSFRHHHRSHHNSSSAAAG
jgi:hypothetical protein